MYTHVYGYGLVHILKMSFLVYIYRFVWYFVNNTTRTHNNKPSLNYGAVYQYITIQHLTNSCSNKRLTGGIRCHFVSMFWSLHSQHILKGSASKQKHLRPMCEYMFGQCDVKHKMYMMIVGIFIHTYEPSKCAAVDCLSSLRPILLLLLYIVYL